MWEYLVLGLRFCLPTKKMSSKLKKNAMNEKKRIEKVTHCTPKSPVEKTSILFNPKHANISTLHRPRPLTATNLSINSSSLAHTNIAALRSPEENFSASPLMYSALRWERPAVRRVGSGWART
jgi:hypothetical protein